MRDLSACKAGCAQCWDAPCLGKLQGWQPTPDLLPTYGELHPEPGSASLLVQITKVVIPPPKEGKARDYAFVHFADPTVVAKLIEDCERGEKPQLEGQPLEVGGVLGSGLKSTGLVS